MKLNHLTSLVTFSIFMSLTLLTPESAQAKYRKFYCGQNQNGIPTTFMKTTKGDSEVVQWVRYLGGASPQKRCQEASANFQKANDNGTLELMHNGFWEGKPVICTVTSEGSSCHTVIMILDPSENSARILSDLNDIIGYGRQVGPIQNSGGEASLYYQFDFDAFEQN